MNRIKWPLGQSVLGSEMNRLVNLYEDVSTISESFKSRVKKLAKDNDLGNWTTRGSGSKLHLLNKDTGEKKRITSDPYSDKELIKKMSSQSSGSTKKKKQPKVLDKEVKMPESKMSEAELRALGLYFTVSNAGQPTGNLEKYIKEGNWTRVIGVAKGDLEEMSMDAGSIDMTPDDLFQELMDEAEEWSDKAKKEDEYVLGEWDKLKKGISR